MKRKLSLFASIFNSVATLVFGAIYGFVFWILASLFFDLGAKGQLVPTVVLFATMALVLVCFVVNVIMIKVSVSSAEKYAKSKVFIIVTVIFNVLLTAFVIYNIFTAEKLLASILLGLFAAILLGASILYIVDLIKEKSRQDTTVSIQPAVEVNQQPPIESK